MRGFHPVPFLSSSNYVLHLLVYIFRAKHTGPSSKWQMRRKDTCLHGGLVALSCAWLRKRSEPLPRSQRPDVVQSFATPWACPHLRMHRLETVCYCSDRLVIQVKTIGTSVPCSMCGRHLIPFVHWQCSHYQHYGPAEHIPDCGGQDVRLISGQLGPQCWLRACHLVCDAHH